MTLYNKTQFSTVARLQIKKIITFRVKTGKQVHVIRMQNTRNYSTFILHSFLISETWTECFELKMLKF